MRKIGKVSTTIVVVDKATSKLNAIYNSLKRVESAFNSLSNASTKVNKVNSAINNLNSKIPDVNKNMNRMNQSLKSTFTSKSNVVNKQILDLGKSARKSTNVINSLDSRLKAVASTYLGIMGTRALFETSDKLTSAENQLNHLHGGDTELTQDSLDKIYDASQDARTDYLDMAKNVGKLMTLAPDAFQGNIDNAIRFQNIMAKTYAVSGASAEEQASSMYQLTQALASGKLQGDELRSVNEGATMAYQQIEKFAQELYKTDDALKDMAADGLITSDIVVAAIMNTGNEIDGAFENTQMTFRQMMTVMKNTAINAFQPFLQQLRKISNSPEFQKIVGKVNEVIENIGNAFTELGYKLEDATVWISENLWVIDSALQAVAWTIGGVLLVNVIQLIGRIKEAVLAALAFGVAHPVLMMILVVVSVLIYKFVEFKNQGMDTLDALANALAYVALGLLICSVLAFIFGFVTIGWILLIIVAIIGLVATIIYYRNQIMGAIFVVGEFFKQIWEWIVASVKASIAQMKDDIHNLGVAWQQGWVGMQRAAYQAILGINQMLLWLGENINKVLSLFGMEIDLSGVKSRIDTYTQKVADAQAREESFNSQYRDSKATFDRVFEEEGGNFEEGWVSRAYDEGFHYFDKDEPPPEEEPPPEDNEIPVSDLGNNYQFDPSAIESDLEDIDKNTGDMSKSMELTEDDLKYLREIANQEAINRFTTAEVRIDMTNNNQVNNTTDLDGIVKYLGKTLKQELEVVANGVY